MECSKQGFWSWEYWESKLGGSSSDNSYTKFAKRQYHKARRRHDEEIIEEQLKDIFSDHKTMTMRSFSSKPFNGYLEHNHKQTVAEAA